MPIKGLTDRESLTPRFPRLGKLRKGGPKPENGRGFGADLEYFRFTSDRDDIVKAFRESYGAQPKDVSGFYLPYATPDENFDTWREHWVAGGLVHRCDGENTVIVRNEQGRYVHESRPCPGKCQLVGRLSIILPGLLRAGFVGYVVFETHSNHDLRNIMAALFSAYDESHKHGGDLQGIPFVLRRFKDTISTPSGSNGKRARRVKNLVAIEPQREWVLNRLALARSEAFVAIPESAGDIDGDIAPTIIGGIDVETGEIVEGEIEEPDIEGEPPEVDTEPGPGIATRPLQPVILKTALTAKAREKGTNGDPATESQYKFLARKLQECFAGNANPVSDYHVALGWLWNVDSAKGLTKAQAGATLDWLLSKSGADDTGDTPLHKHAPEEATRVLAAAMKDNAQAAEAPSAEEQEELPL